MFINKLEVSPDGKNFYVHVEVPTTAGYEDVKIKSITFSDPFKYRYGMGYPDSNKYHITADSLGTQITDPKKFIASIPIELTNREGSTRSIGFYFMYVKYEGDVGYQVDDCFDKEVITAAINWYPIYNLAIKYLTQYKADCLNEEFKDKLLDLHWIKDTLQKALDLEQYEWAISWYQDMFYPQVLKGECLNVCTNLTYRFEDSNTSVNPYNIAPKPCKSC